MNHNQQPVLITRVAQLVHKLNPQRGNFRIHFPKSSRSRRKTLLAAEYVKANRPPVVVRQPALLSDDLKEGSFGSTLGIPDEVMPFPRSEDVGLQPTHTNH